MSREKVVTLATDFNSQLDNVRARSRFDNINPGGRFVDVTNSLRAFSLTDGAFSLWEYYKEFPRGIHVVIVDPGVGTNRKGIALETGNGTFIGPDNGVLYPAASDAGIQSAWVLDREKLGAGAYSTFDGRDLFVPAAAELSRGAPLKDIATEISPDDAVTYAFRRDQVVQVDSLEMSK
jgi:S-adenosyl-L-methionine hydrolase (adenosine-forming)